MAMDAKWLKEQFARSGKTQADLARYLGIQPPMVSKMVRGGRKVQGNEVDQIRAFFGVKPDAPILSDQRSQNIDTAAATILDANITPPLRSEMPRNVPVLGTVSGGRGGLQMNGDAVDWVRRPPRLEGRTDVFGVYVEDLSMVPAFKPGALVIVEKARPPAPGDDVVIEIMDGGEQRALIKNLVFSNHKIVRLQQYNPAKEIEIDRLQIVRMFRVMPLSDLLGV
jgi:phage repressor protein C with HTH and peptisase S24 domain